MSANKHTWAIVATGSYIDRERIGHTRSCIDKSKSNHTWIEAMAGHEQTECKAYHTWAEGMASHAQIVGKMDLTYIEGITSHVQVEGMTGSVQQKAKWVMQGQRENGSHITIQSIANHGRFCIAESKMVMQGQRAERISSIYIYKPQQVMYRQREWQAVHRQRAKWVMQGQGKTDHTRAKQRARQDHTQTGEK